MAIPRPYRKPIRRYSKLVKKEAAKHGISPEALLAKVLKGESGYDMNSTSSAGAKGAAQFMPETRRMMIDKYGIDPWKNEDEAVHGMAIYLKNNGVKGYNPGMSSYTDYILKQPVGNVRKQIGAGGGSGTGGARPPRASQGAAASTVPQLTVAPPGTDPSVLLSALTQRPPAPPQSAPQAPAFAATPPLPAGYQPISAGAPQQPQAQGGLAAQLAAIRGLTGPQMPSQAPSGSDTSPTGGTGPRRRGSRSSTGKSGTVMMDGYPVNADIAADLKWAKKHGWGGQVISGWRDPKRVITGAGPIAPQGQSQHRFKRAGRGAVDVTDPEGLKRVLRRLKGTQLRHAGSADPPHFSQNPPAGSY